MLLKLLCVSHDYHMVPEVLCRIIKMSLLCKPPEPLSFMGNVAQNWREFVEPLQCYDLEGTESTADKGDKVKIGIPR